MKEKTVIERFIEMEMEYFRPMLERQKIASDEARLAWRNETVSQRIERISLETYELSNGVVSNGLFQGLKLNRDAWWGKSDLGSQCLGLYEKEVSDFISKQEPYEVFLDIGAADGYYGIGMLHAKKAKKSICFELSEQGQQAIKNNWILNHRPGELCVYGEANPQSIEDIAPALSSNSLVLIDIEGIEFSLLSPRTIYILRHCTVIIEIHNWVVDFKEKYIKLLKDLDVHFEVTALSHSNRDIQKIPLLRSYTDDNRLLVTSERRPCLMRFLHLEPKHRLCANS
jgi:hypothetical protein